MNTPPNHLRTIKSFVRREGRMTAAQQRALQTLLPVYGVHPSGKIDLTQLFPNHPIRCLDIGFGMGDSLLTMAQQDPSAAYLGIEVHSPGVGSTLHRLHTLQMENIRILQEDAVQVVQHRLLDGQLDKAMLLFPDPWHKKKHHKRRIVQTAFIQSLTLKLKIGGSLHIATDWQDYAEHCLQILSSIPNLRNNSTDGSYSDRQNRPATKYEGRGIRLGHQVWDLIFTRIEN